MTAPGQQPFIADANTKPHLNVIRYLEAAWSHPERYRLLHHRGSFYAWTGTHWRELADDTLAAMVYDVFERAQWLRPGTGQNPPAWTDYDINPARLKALTEGLKSKILIDQAVNVPVWVDGNRAWLDCPLPASEVVALRNCLLHTSSRSWYSHTPRFFNHFSADYDYEPGTAVPQAWMAFLHSVWPHDTESIECLQEIFGYLLTQRNEQHKMFMLYGAKRGGKGTIIRVLTSLLGGESNVASSSVAELNKDFGLANLENKSLAVMSDLRFNSRDDGTAVGNLLRITGDDTVTINKKFKPQYDAHLPVRFLIASNELPKMRDESGALKERIILLKFTESFLGREDKDLTAKLMAGLPGILNWALEGLARLNARGRFVQPKSGLEDLAVVQALTSPTLSFIEDCLVVDSDLECTKDEAYDAWRAWCERTGTYTGDASSFGKNLRAALPMLRDTRPRVDGRLGPRKWRGIGVASDAASSGSYMDMARNLTGPTGLVK